MRRTFFVLFWYASKAVLKRFWKLVEEVVVEETLDIVSASRNVVAGRGVVVVVSFTGTRTGTPSSGGVLVQASSACTARAFSVQPPRASIKDRNIVLYAGYLSALLCLL